MLWLMWLPTPPTHSRPRDFSVNQSNLSINPACQLQDLQTLGAAATSNTTSPRFLRRPVIACVCTAHTHKYKQPYNKFNYNSCKHQTFSEPTEKIRHTCISILSRCPFEFCIPTHTEKKKNVLSFTFRLPFTPLNILNRLYSFIHFSVSQFTLSPLVELMPSRGKERERETERRKGKPKIGFWRF